jgi:hypothetical protein
MDRYALNALLGVIGTAFTGLIVFSFTRLGRALATRLEGGASRAPEERIARLEAGLDQTRRELLETQERLDFAERLLAREQEAHRLPPE